MTEILLQFIACHAQVRLQDGHVLVGIRHTPDTCVTTCGDGIVAGTEACDTGDTNIADDPIVGCYAENCTVYPGFQCAGSPSICVSTCGDGFRNPPETCDDSGATAAEGGCVGCQVTSGWSCVGGSPTSPDVCTCICGDGKLFTSVEQCDDGNFTETTYNGYGCVNCLTDNGWTCSGGTQTHADTCTPICGDSKRFGPPDGPEQCDDGNNTQRTYSHGCLNCVTETGWSCTGGSPISADTCTAICGDGLKFSTETCDDGNSS